MRFALIFTSVSLLSLSACGSRTSCDEAVDKLKSCGLSGNVIVSGSCDARSACEADCINGASCAEISAAFAGTPNSYSACDDGCATK